MGRNYSDPTIKTLFAEASGCAWPGCERALILWDRGANTVVVQIADIRSEKLHGPRHDPAFRGDLDGPDNLLLLCGDLASAGRSTRISLLHRGARRMEARRNALRPAPGRRSLPTRFVASLVLRIRSGKRCIRLHG